MASTASSSSFHTDRSWADHPAGHFHSSALLATLRLHFTCGHLPCTCAACCTSCWPMASTGLFDAGTSNDDASTYRFRRARLSAIDCLQARLGEYDVAKFLG